MMKRERKTLHDEPTGEKTLRLLPGIIIVISQWICWMWLPNFTSGTYATAIGVFGGLLGGLGILIWWTFFSRAPKSERWLAIIIMILALVVIQSFTHVSIKTGLGNLMYYVYAIPTLSLAFVVWAVFSRRLSSGPRRITMALSILLSCGVWTLVKSDGLSGSASADFSWRWAETNEEKLLAQSDEEFIVRPYAAIETEAEWPGFRGPDRDGIIHGIQIETDWAASPPVELWRKPVGPGCSSFAVHGELLFTQEQRGENEVVSCYNLNTGETIWKHQEKARFWDSHAGAGPRSTPTIRDSLVYTLGATGILNVLNERDGSVVWSRKAASDIETELSEWGITSSPLVVDDVVIVAIGGTLIGYDVITGEPRWFGPDGGESFSSPHLLIVDDIVQVIMLGEPGMISIAPANGSLLWEYLWEGVRIVQPALTPDGDILIDAGDRKGMHLIKVRHESDKWNIEQLWKTNRMRPDFNDFVVHKGHAYGFDGLSLVCIDIKKGNREWREGRFGGQLVLLKDQDLLLVLTEKGEIMLVKAIPDRFTELTRFQAIEGKTWNHPVMVGKLLLVRNTKEMVAFRFGI